MCAKEDPLMRKFSPAAVEKASEGEPASEVHYEHDDLKDQVGFFSGLLILSVQCLGNAGRSLCACVWGWVGVKREVDGGFTCDEEAGSGTSRRPQRKEADNERGTVLVVVSDDEEIDW